MISKQSVFKSSESLLSIAQLAANHGYRLVATIGKGHKVEQKAMTLADIQAAVTAANSGVIFIDELNDIISKYNNALHAKHYIQLSRTAGGEITYHVN